MIVFPLKVLMYAYYYHYIVDQGSHFWSSVKARAVSARAKKVG